MSIKLLNNLKYIMEQENEHNCLVNVVTLGVVKESEIIHSQAPTGAGEGNYDIIFGPMAIIPLLNIVGEGASIFSVEAGLSFFAGRQGKKVGSPDITLYDDGRLDGGVNSTKADDEGVATRRNVLIEKGIFKQYLHNTSTA